MLVRRTIHFLTEAIPQRIKALTSEVMSIIFNAAADEPMARCGYMKSKKEKERAIFE